MFRRFASEWTIFHCSWSTSSGGSPKGAGKNIRHIEKHTLEQLKGYDWPGNIRELQNVVERAVILCETDTFDVDESWLRSEPAQLTSVARWAFGTRRTVKWR